MVVRIKVDTSRAERKLRHAQKQLPFAIAQALTATVRDAKGDVEERIPQALDRPVPFTERSIAIVSARKGKLVARVFVKDKQAAYLAFQEKGGTRPPRPGAPVLVPVKQRLNSYGNIGKGVVNRLLKADGVFATDGKSPKTQHLAPGIYRRPKYVPTGQKRGRPVAGAAKVDKKTRAARRKRGRPPVLLVFLGEDAAYTPRFDFEDTVRKAVLEKFERNFDAAFRKAMATAR